MPRRWYVAGRSRFKPRVEPSGAVPYNTSRVGSFEALVAERIAGLDARRRGALYRAVEAAEVARALLHRHRAGARPVPHPIALTPFVVSRRLPDSVAAELIHRFQTRAPGLYREAAGDFRALCPLAEAAAGWVLRAGGPPAAPWQLMIRPDVGLAAGQPGLPILFESNATALAGLYNHAAGVAILRQEVFPRLLTAAEGRRLADPPDLLALTVRWVARAARRLGRRRRGGVAFVEPRGPVTAAANCRGSSRPSGRPASRRALAPDDLRLVRGGVRLGDLPVDVVYRDLGYDDLGALPEPSGRLAGWLDRLAAGAVVPGDAGEFSHKGLLECLTRSEYQAPFTPAERRFLRACVPWTRVLGARYTTGPDGRRVDLPEYARGAARGLLIKPNLGSGGTGILLGREAPPARWDARIARALREPGAWVVQERRPGTRRPMVYLRAGRAYAGPCYFSLGLFYAPGDLAHCRCESEPIVSRPPGARPALSRDLDEPPPMIGLRLAASVE
jgi:hypothetical protein